MSQAATTNFFIQSGPHFIIQFKEASTISSTVRNDHFSQTHDAIMSSRQAIFAFIVTVLLNFLQVKYGGGDQSPFETHPRTVFGAVSSLLVYCLSYDAKLKLSANQPTHIYACFLRLSMAFSGPLSIASMSSILFPPSLCPLLFSLSLLFSICQLSRSQIKRIWSWVRAVIMKKFSHQLHQHGRRRGLISVELPWLPDDHGFADLVDVLPPV